MSRERRESQKCGLRLFLFWKGKKMYMFCHNLTYGKRKQGLLLYW